MSVKSALATAADYERLGQCTVSNSNWSNTVSPADPSVSMTTTPLIAPEMKPTPFANIGRHCANSASVTRRVCRSFHLTPGCFLSGAFCGTTLYPLCAHASAAS